LRIVALALAFSFVAIAEDANWPNWRGPQRDSTQPAAKGLPSTWSRTENVLWRTALPSWSAASPAVWRDTVFVTSAQVGFSDTGSSGLIGHAIRGLLSKWNSEDDIVLLAIDAGNGSVRWERTVGDGNRMWLKQNEASPSPVTDGTNVWAVTGGGVVSCFDFDGDLKWRRELQTDYGEFGLNWGYASSPVLHEGDLYIEVLHGHTTDDPSYVLSLDAADGHTKWRIERPTDAISESHDAYTTPTLAEIDGTTYLVVTGAGYVTMHDLHSGKEVARVGGLIPDVNRNYRIVGSPSVVGDILIAPSRQRPLLAFRMAPGPKLTRLWNFDRGADVPTPASDENHVYVVTDRGILTVLNLADGSPVGSPTRLEPGNYSSSPVIADGKLYVVSEEGTTSVVRLDDASSIASVNKIDEYTLSTPAIGHDRIYMRSAKALYCFRETAQ